MAVLPPVPRTPPETNEHEEHRGFFESVGHALGDLLGGLRKPGSPIAVANPSLSAGLWGMEQAARPGQAVTSAAREAWEHGHEGGYGTALRRVGHEAVEGFLGHRPEDTATAVLQQMGVVSKSNPFGSLPASTRGVAGLATDVVGGAVLDPLSYLDLGVGKATKPLLIRAERVLTPERMQVLTREGVGALGAAERGALRRAVGEEGFRQLARNARGGIGIRVPFVPGDLGRTRTLVPAETFRAPLRAGTQALGSMPVIGTRVIPAVADRVQMTERLFVPRAAVKQSLGQRVANELGDNVAEYRGSTGAAIHDDLAPLLVEARRAGVSTDDLRTLGRALDIGGSRSDLPDRLHALFDRADALRHSIEADEVAAGINRGSSIDTGDYLPRVLSQEAAKAKNAGRRLEHATGTPRLGDMDDAFLRSRRVMPGEPAHVVNEALAPNLGFDLFDENALAALASRSSSARRAIGTRTLLTNLESVLDDTGEPLVRRLGVDDAVPDGFELVGPQHLPESAGRYAAHADVAKELEAVYNRLGTDRDTRRLLAGLDTWRRWWASSATVLRPRYHENNVIGNFMANWTAGLAPGDPVYLRAMKIQAKAARGALDGELTKYMTAGERKLYDLARHHNAIGSGFAATDLAEDAVARASTAGRRMPNLNPLSENFVGFEAGRKVGNAAENNARLALFIHQLDATGDATRAAREVRLRLFDYADLAPFESNVMRRLMAFYTWTRKATPMFVAAALRHPEQLANMHRFRTALASRAEDEGDMPDWARRQGLIPVPRALGRTLTHLPLIGAGDPEHMAVGIDVPQLSISDRVLTPAYSLVAQAPIVGDLLPDGEPWDEAALDLAGNFSGGLPGVLRSGFESALGRQAFGGQYLGGREKAPVYLAPFEHEGSVTRRTSHLVDENIPLLPPLRALLPRGERERDAASRRRLSLLYGVSSYDTSN